MGFSDFANFHQDKAQRQKLEESKNNQHNAFIDDGLNHEDDFNSSKQHENPQEIAEQESQKLEKSKDGSDKCIVPHEELHQNQEQVQDHNQVWGMNEELVQQNQEPQRDKLPVWDSFPDAKSDHTNSNNESEESCCSEKLPTMDVIREHPVEEDKEVCIESQKQIDPFQGQVSKGQFVTHFDEKCPEEQKEIDQGRNTNECQLEEFNNNSEDSCLGIAKNKEIVHQIHREEEVDLQYSQTQDFQQSVFSHDVKHQQPLGFSSSQHQQPQIQQNMNENQMCQQEHEQEDEQADEFFDFPEMTDQQEQFQTFTEVPKQQKTPQSPNFTNFQNIRMTESKVFEQSNRRQVVTNLNQVLDLKPPQQTFQFEYQRVQGEKLVRKRNLRSSQFSQHAQDLKFQQMETSRMKKQRDQALRELSQIKKEIAGLKIDNDFMKKSGMVQTLDVSHLRSEVHGLRSMRKSMNLDNKNYKIGNLYKSSSIYQLRK